MGDDADLGGEAGTPPGFQREEIPGDEVAADVTIDRLFRDKLGRMDRWALLNVVKALPRYVDDGEEPLGLAAPMFQKTMGLLAVTDRKLVFLLQRSRPDEELLVDRLVVPFASVESAVMASVVDLKVVTPEREYVFRGKAKQMAEVSALIAEQTGQAQDGSDSSG